MPGRGVIGQRSWDHPIDWTSLEDAVRISTSRLARTYGRYGMDSGDIAGELWLWATKHQAKLSEYLWRPEEPRKDQMRGFAAAVKSLFRAGDRYCRKEKAKRLGYEPHDEVFYDEQRIMDWLAVRSNGLGVLPDSSTTERVSGRSTAPNEGWNVEATLADIERALTVLSPEESAIVQYLYGEGMPVATVAAELGISRSTVEARASRALFRMVEALGGPSPWR